MGIGGERGEGGRCLFRIHEPDLSRCHAGVLVQVRPGRVDDGDVVFFVAC